MTEHEQAGLRLTRDAGIARIRFARPEAGNSLTRPMVGRITEFVEDVSGDPDVRVVVFSAVGEQFCTGPDLRVALDANDSTTPSPQHVGDVARGTRRWWQRLIVALLDCEKPVLAAVNGTAAGAGAQLVLACDLVIASERARLIEIFVRRGLAPDAGAAYLLTRLVGLQRAKRMCFLGEAVPAQEAYGLGLVTEVVPADSLDSRVEELVAQLAGAPTAAIAVAKRLINHAPDVDRSSALWEEAYLQESIVTRTADATEGMRSFVEGRKPNFQGH